MLEKEYPLVLVAAIAEVCHQANKAYCESVGDLSQENWNYCKEWQRESAINGVLFNIMNPEASQSGTHENWRAEKKADGWVYGEKKDAEKKTHPCMLDYEDLPEHQRTKDALFQGIVNALK